jgi:hypothetical protein
MERKSAERKSARTVRLMLTAEAKNQRIRRHGDTVILLHRSIAPSFHRSIVPSFLRLCLGTFDSFYYFY